MTACCTTAPGYQDGAGDGEYLAFRDDAREHQGDSGGAVQPAALRSPDITRGWSEEGLRTKSAPSMAACVRARSDTRWMSSRIRVRHQWLLISERETERCRATSSQRKAEG